MIFYHNYPELASKEEIKDAEEYWIHYLGPFLSEFEEKGGSVTINFDKAKESTNRYSFSLSDPYDTHEFITRFNQYKP